MIEKEPVRDDLPVVFVVLDGLGDRPCAALDGNTPLEVAATPVLDELAARGANGIHEPFGPGWATSSERAHWEMFGLSHVRFPGRTLLEWLGVGGIPPLATPLWHLAVRRGELSDGVVTITGRMNSGDIDIAPIVDQVLRDWTESFAGDDVTFTLAPLRLGEWVLLGHGLTSVEVSDTDPLFEHVHPWMRPVPLHEAVEFGGDRLTEARRSAKAIQEYLLGARAALLQAGLPINVPTTKWPSIAPHPMSYRDHVGVDGAMVTSSALYRGFARLLGMREVDIAPEAGDAALGLSARVNAARHLLAEPQRPDFIHVHTKAPDEAGHTKDPNAKVSAIEACDAAIASLMDLVDRGELVLAVTGDHATPSEGALLHSGDPTPFLVVAADQRRDQVRSFGETQALGGTLGRLRAADIAPLLHGLARRPFFIGHRPGAFLGPALPISPQPMPAHSAEFFPVVKSHGMMESTR